MKTENSHWNTGPCNLSHLDFISIGQYSFRLSMKTSEISGLKKLCHVLWNVATDLKASCMHWLSWKPWPKWAQRLLSRFKRVLE